MKVIFIIVIVLCIVEGIFTLQDAFANHNERKQNENDRRTDDRVNNTVNGEINGDIRENQ